MTTYVKITYDRVDYYIDPTDSSTIYNSKFEKLSEKFVKSLNFLNLNEFHLLLTKIHKTPKLEFLDELEFKKILCENLIYNNLKISTNYVSDLLSNINYKIVKRNDTGAILALLDKIISKNKGLCYDYLSLDLGHKITLDKNIKTNKYFKEPYGRISGNMVYGIPLIFPKQMQILLKNNTNSKK